MPTTNNQPDPLPNGGVDFAGRCLRCGFKVESTASCRCEARAAFEAMCDEQIEDYKEYLRRCGGTPISKILP